MAGSAFMFLDESGVPGALADSSLPFVVGGVGTVRDPGALASAWSRTHADLGIKRKKGASFTREQLWRTAEFLIDQQAVPIVGHSRLTEPEIADLVTKMKALPEITPTNGIKKMSGAHYLWLRQVPATVYLGLYQLANRFGPIDALTVSLDKFSLRRHEEELVRRSIHRHCIGSGLIKVIKAEVEGQLDSAVDRSVDRLATSLQVTAEKLTIDFNLKGSLGSLADAVSATFRRRMLGDRAAADAWELLTKAFPVGPDDLPDTLAQDLTRTVRDAATAAWRARR